MKKNDPDPCGCCGNMRPIVRLQHLISTLEREEAERKAKEKQEMLAAASRWALKEGAA